MAGKVFRTLKREVEEGGLKLSITKGGWEGRSQAITSCKLSERQVSGMQQEFRELFWQRAWKRWEWT